MPVRIFGHEIRALIDSGASRNFISPAGVTKCGLSVESHNTFLELGDGKKVLSRGRAVDVPVVTSGYEMKTNLTVSNLLHGVDVVLGMTWLKVADPLIRWSTGQMYIPDSISSFQRIMGQWLDKQVKVGTVRVLSTNESVGISEAALRNCFNRNVEIPKILGCEDDRDTELLEEFSRPGECTDCKIF